MPCAPRGLPGTTACPPCSVIRPRLLQAAFPEALAPLGVELAECPGRKGLAGRVPRGLLCPLSPSALPPMTPPLHARAHAPGPGLFLQEKRRAERAEQQRIRSEREKERQARLAVSGRPQCTAPRPAPARPAPSGHRASFGGTTSTLGAGLA